MLRTSSVRDSTETCAKCHAHEMGASARHERAVANTLGMADEAACAGDYRTALSWLATLQAIGDELPASYRAKREAWAAALHERADLDRKLAKLLDSARESISARYAALMILDDQRTRVEHFLTAGLIDPATRHAIGAHPAGRGVLGELLANRAPIRLDDVSEHPSSYGFPAGHPRMRSFLGVPILIEDRPAGNLCLADKEGCPFSQADEHALTALALSVATTIAEHQRPLVRDGGRWNERGREDGAQLLERERRPSR